MADSETENLPTAPVPQEIFPNTLPSELFKFIFEHSNVVTLMRLSATSRILHLQVHNFFTSRLSDQAKKYPEVRDSLSRLGWTKEHNDWVCNCFKLVAGPGFTWGQLSERKSFPVVSGMSSSATNITTVADKMMPNSASSLVSFKSSPIAIGPLSSYDQVLAFSLKKHMPDAGHALCIYNPSTLRKITEIDLIECDTKIPEDIRNVRVNFIAFAKDTMAILLESYGRYILLWKMNTKEPKEEEIALLQRIDPPPNYIYVIKEFGTFRLNDRFITILEDTQIKVLSRSDGALVSQIGLVGLHAWALEKGQGGHIAFAFRSSFVGHPRLVFQIFSVTQGLVIQKELEWPFPAVQYMNWFGPHLVVILKQDNVLSMMSWQPGFTSFLPCPLNVPVVRRSSRGGGSGASEWAAGCLHVDYRGITMALKNGTSYRCQRLF